MSKPNLIGLSLEDLGRVLSDLGQPAYRGRQLFKWLYNDRVYDFDRMTNFTKAFRGQLADTCRVQHPAIHNRLLSADGTEKFVFVLEDSSRIESVLVELDDHKAVCVSSQVGCALDCKFCATGTMGFVRNLTVGEILSQPMVMRDLYGAEAFRNIVFMGMGEPLNNYDHLLAFSPIVSAWVSAPRRSSFPRPALRRKSDVWPTPVSKSGWPSP
jgi:23S rRNA (adenine2503-C2)-methyltransferase